jgi:hypothetical protein
MKHLLFTVVAILLSFGIVRAEEPVGFELGFETPPIERISVDKTDLFEGDVTHSNSAIMSGIASVGLSMTLEEYYAKKKDIPNPELWADISAIGVNLFIEAYDGSLGVGNRAVYMDGQFTQANIISAVSSIVLKRALNKIIN